MKCLACNKTIPNNSAYCSHCGEKQPELAKANRNKKAANGMGTVYKRGTTWTALVRKSVDFSYDPNGDALPQRPKLVSKTKGGFQKRTDALKYLPELSAQLERELTETPKNQRIFTLAQYWETYERDVVSKLSKPKQINYSTAWTRLQPIANKNIANLTVSDLRDIVSESCKTFYPARDMKTLLTKLFELAAADGIVSKDLPSFIVLPEKKEKGQDAFTLDEAQSIANQWLNGNIFAGYILLMMTTSMMPGELFKVEKSMIDLDSRRIIGAGIKTRQRKTQSIVFPSYMIPVIEKLMQENPDPVYLMPRIDDTTFRKQYYRVLDLAGCRRLTPYSCRHTTGTTLSLDPAVSAAAAARILRHSIRMTERYTHAKDDDALEAIEHMPNFLELSSDKPQKGDDNEQHE